MSSCLHSDTRINGNTRLLVMKDKGSGDRPVQSTNEYFIIDVVGDYRTTY
jgi:hypothetical protein